MMFPFNHHQIQSHLIPILLPIKAKQKRLRRNHTSSASQGIPKSPRRRTSSFPSIQAQSPLRRPYAPLIPLGIPWEQFRAEYNRSRPARRIFKRDFPRYNRALNKAHRQSKKRPEHQGRDYIPVYLSDSSVTLGNSIRESSLEPIDNDDLFGTTVQPVEFNPLTSTQSLRVPNNTPEPKSCPKKQA